MYSKHSQNRTYSWHIGAILLLGEAIFSWLIINRVAYTEIDWRAYMQQVHDFMNGERDYRKLRGDTGPLVYPAGFVYVYSALFAITDRGSNIRVAQYIFEGIYLLTQAVVFSIYFQSKKVPKYVLPLLCMSKRLHSIFLLRCFNDPIAMLLLYTSILFMLVQRWTSSSILFSLALSVKMNVLLFLPAFGFIQWINIGSYYAVKNLVLVTIIQIALGYPFLIANPGSYLGRAFEFSRRFDYQWTVNWRMISKDIFTSATLPCILLAGHILMLILFMTVVWCRRKPSMLYIILNGLKSPYFGCYTLTKDNILVIMFTSNLIGILFARSLHYQFYSWYFHTLPYLLWQCNWGLSDRHKPLKIVIRLTILLTIELCWLTYPSTVLSSCTLLLCHCLILGGVLKGPFIRTNTTAANVYPSMLALSGGSAVLDDTNYSPPISDSHFGESASKKVN